MPKKVNPGVDDLATVRPDLAAQWHPTLNDLTSSQVLPGATKKAWWQCEHGHQWEATISNRSKGRGCPYCAGRYVITGVNDLATLNPQVAAQWHPTKNTKTPDDVIAQSNTKYWWMCERGHEWQATPNARLNKTRVRGCPYCSARIVKPGDNDLATVNPVVGAICDEGHVYSRTAGNQCRLCSSGQQSSRAEDDIAEVLEQLGLGYQRHARPFKDSKYELDFYIPDLNFAIHYNGCYWHAERSDRPHDYHQLKNQIARDAGITLYQIWSDDWATRRDVIIRGIAHRTHTNSRLSHVLPQADPRVWSRTYARQTTVAEVDHVTMSSFLDANHIQGMKSGTIYLGLQTKNGDLCAGIVLTREGPESKTWRIDRYATCGSVVGGFTKLLAYAEKQLTPDKWVTFADLCVSEGKTYENNGFTIDKVLAPDYAYLVRGKRVHKFNYRLSRFRNDPELTWEEGLSETQLAQMNGLQRIWDAGKIRYVKHVAS